MIKYMRYLYLLVTVSILLLFFSSCTQSEYDKTLMSKVAKIMNYSGYDNTPVVFSDSFCEKLYARATPENNAYLDYKFLRDSAKTEDLLELLTHQHPFVRTYAFGALSHRQYDGLYSIIIKNLSDSSAIEVTNYDYSYLATPPDLMIAYLIDKLSLVQKDTIVDLALTKHHHLKTLQEILLFCKPKLGYYPYIKTLAQSKSLQKFGLVALAKFKQEEDIELIKEGFNTIDYYRGYKVFFMAIEAFNHEEFKESLISYKGFVPNSFDNSGYNYYFNALAKYHDKDCLRVLSSLVDSDEQQNKAYQYEYLRMIYSALKKYESKEYKPLMTKIENSLKDQKEIHPDINHLENSPWNY